MVNSLWPKQRPDRWTFVIAAFFILALGKPTDVSSQLVRGTLVEQDTGTPIEGAAIVVLTPDDRRLAWTLTDAAGRFFVQVKWDGRFVLRADRIGHASTRSETLEVGPGDTLVYRMEAPVEPVELVGLTVEGSGRDCKIRPEEGAATARVWEEARKALEAAAQTSKRGTYQFMLRRSVRDLDNRGRKVLKEINRFDRRLQARPFESLEASKLIEDGFMQSNGDTRIYYAPDADVLLSDVFLDSHCFKLREGEDENEGLLGLEFEPTGGRDVPEINGILWLDPVSAELQRLDFRYENLGFPVGRAPVGGTVVFAGLPNGTWFVRAWSIRMPMFGQAQAPSRIRRGPSPIRRRRPVVGIHEESAVVLEVYADGSLVVESGAGTIAGVVVREDGGRPIADAVVTVWITGQQAFSGEDGLFRLTALGDGIYELLVSHPDLTSLGFGGELTPVRAVYGEVTSVRLTLPSEKRVLEEVCVGPGPRRGGIVAGWVRNSETREPISDARVLLTAVTNQRIGAQTTMRTQMSIEVRTRDDGFFIYCGTATDTLLDVEVTAEGMGEWNGTVRVLRTGYVARVSVQLEPKRKDP